MKFTGRLTWQSPKQEGTSKNGNHWEKVDIVVTENTDRYPNQVLCSVMGDKIGQLMGIQLGNLVEIDFDLRVRDWTTQAGEARKSMDASLWKIVSLEQVEQHQQPTAPASPATQQINFAQPQQNDGLPF